MVERWPLRGVGFKEWERGTSQITFISYLFNLQPKAARLGQFKSNYWTELPNVLDEDKIRSSWLHTYVKNSIVPNAKSAAKLIQSFNKKHRGKQIHTTLDAFLNMKIIARTMRDYLRVQKISGLNTATVSDCLIQEGQLINHIWPLFKGLETKFAGMTQFVTC